MAVYGRKLRRGKRDAPATNGFPERCVLDVRRGELAPALLERLRREMWRLVREGGSLELGGSAEEVFAYWDHRRGPEEAERVVALLEDLAAARS